MQYSVNIRLLQQDRDGVGDIYSAKRKKLQAEKANKEKLEKLDHNELSEMDLIDDEIHRLHSSRVIHQAESLFLPTPEFKQKDGAWEESHITGRWRLKRDAIVELRAAIRKEQKELRELRQMRVIWITAITGTIGAITGLVSVLIHSTR